MRIAYSVAFCALIAVSAGRASGAVASRVDKTLSCRVRVGVGANVRHGNMLPIILQFDNAGEPRVIRARTEGALQVSSVFSVPRGGGVRRCLYIPVHGNLTYYGPGSVVLSDADTGRILRRIKIGGQMRSLNVLEGAGDHGSGGPRLIALSIARSTALTINADIFAPFALGVSHVLSSDGLPDSWLGYSGIDVIIVEHEAWAEPGFDKKPLIDWLAMGGICMLAGAPEEGKADIVRRLAAEAPFFEAPTGQAAGEGAPGKGGSAEKTQPNTHLVGMGGITFVDRTFLAAPHKGVLSRRSLRTAALNRVSEVQRQKYPRIQGVDSPPFWSVLVALLAFAALVGPVGWWYLIKRKGRLLLYYAAAPAASACAIMLTIAAAMFHEGVTPYVNCVAVRFVDQRVKKRIDLSQFGVYVPFGFGASLTGTATELPHFLVGSEDYDDGELTLVSKPSGRGRKYEGVLPPRSRVWFGRELIELERRRLVVWQEGEKLFVENHLGCTLKSLVVSHKGKFAHFDRVADGAKAAATLTDRAAIGSYQAANESEAEKIIRCLTLKKSYHLAFGRWRRMFESGNAYAAQTEDLTGEHVWLGSFRDQGAKCAIFGVY